MSANVNKIIVVGNIGKTPEVHYTSKGNAVTTLSLATNKKVKKEDGTWKEEANWHRAVVWGNRAEACGKYLKTGHRVYIEGSVQSNNWTDKDGITRSNTEIIVGDIKFLGGKSKVEESDTPPISQ